MEKIDTAARLRHARGPVASNSHYMYTYKHLEKINFLNLQKKSLNESYKICLELLK